MAVLTSMSHTSSGSILEWIGSVVDDNFETEEWAMMSSQPWQAEKPTDSSPGLPVELLRVVNTKLDSNFPASL